MTDFELLASGIVRESMSVFLSQVCSNLLQQPQETHRWAKANPKTCFRGKRRELEVWEVPHPRNDQGALTVNPAETELPVESVLTQSDVKFHIYP